jgi:hypothetical protein
MLKKPADWKANLVLFGSTNTVFDNGKITTAISGIAVRCMIFKDPCPG